LEDRDGVQQEGGREKSCAIEGGETDWTEQNRDPQNDRGTGRRKIGWQIVAGVEKAAKASLTSALCLKVSDGRKRRQWEEKKDEMDGDGWGARRGISAD